MFTPLTFEVIIDRFVVVAILLFTFSSFPPSLLLKEVPLTFLLVQFWWWLTPLAFSYLGT